MIVLEILKDMFPSHRGVYSSEEYRKTVINIFMRIGANMVLTGDTEDLSNARGMVKAITVLEQYTGTGSIIRSINSRVAATKTRDLGCYNSAGRDLLKFYRKRISCKCLKKIHLVARKTMPKLGLCCGCGKEKERELLNVCSKCMIAQYCSRECQVSNWPDHESNCSLFVRAVAANLPKNYSAE